MAAAHQLQSVRRYDEWCAGRAAWPLVHILGQCAAYFASDRHAGAVEIPTPLLRRKLLAAGWTDAELRRRRLAGGLVTVGRGAYLSGGDERLDDAAARHALAAVAAGAGDGAISHVSAAALHGLPVWGLRLERAHRTRHRDSGGRRSRGIHLHTAPLDADEIVEIGGVPLTTAARTVVDVARNGPFEPAVAVADAALRLRLVTHAELEAAVTRARGWPGVPRARRVVAFADGRSESVGESRSRVAIARAGLPVPELQFAVRIRGDDVAFTDFGWPRWYTVGEFDGRVKYGRRLAPGQEPGDVVFAEKVREDAIRDTGQRVVRWTWDELPSFADVAARIRRGCGLA